MRLRGLLHIGVFVPIFAGVTAGTVEAQEAACVQPQPGSVVTEPEEVRSHNGLLELDLTYKNVGGVGGQAEYCYHAPDGSRSPTLHVRPGDKLIIHLKNSLEMRKSGSQPMKHRSAVSLQMPCASAKTTSTSTNLHFHGINIRPTCHEDDVLHTAIQPGDDPFTYSFQIPRDQPPGLYWYHPHIHGFTNVQVAGGGSGAIVVDGIEGANRQLAGMHERLLAIRDQDLIHPEAQPTGAGYTPPVFRDAEGDILNTGTGGGKPARDLSINFVPVPWPDYPPAKIMVKPEERELWRVLNASAITFLDLQIVIANKPQSIGVVSLDGVPINENGMTPDRIIWTDHIFLPPAARAEFIMNGLAEGAQAQLITRSVDTGPAGENDPARGLASIIVSDKAPELATLPSSTEPMHHSEQVWIGNVKPVRTRKLYFSERPSDANRGDSPTVFMLTVDGKTPVPFNPHATEPDITVEQGGVEDWVIENRSTEAHAFHIHQVHFMLTQWNGAPVDEPFLRDTINVPYWRGPGTSYPSVTIRVDFRDPNAVGTFLYHCHLLEHEDGGMMGTIRVVPRANHASSGIEKR